MKTNRTNTDTTGKYIPFIFKCFILFINTIIPPPSTPRSSSPLPTHADPPPFCLLLENKRDF